MGFSASYYTQHPSEEKEPVSLDGLTLDKFDTIVSRSSLSNADRTADAITKADGFAWQVANPWYKRTNTNLKLVNNWLASQNIHHPTYPDFTEAAEALASTGLLDIDEAARAQHLDGNGPKTFKGALTGREYNNLDTMLRQERQTAIEQQGSQTEEERAFDALPAENQKRMLLDGLRTHQAQADATISQQNADSWLTLHPEFRDDEYNGRLLLSQLKANGVTGAVTIEEYEVANRQLVASGLLRQNPAVLKKQQAAEVVARAEHAVKNSAAFDTTTPEEAYALPLDEVKRRANGNFTGIGF